MAVSVLGYHGVLSDIRFSSESSRLWDAETQSCVDGNMEEPRDAEKQESA